MAVVELSVRSIPFLSFLLICCALSDPVLGFVVTGSTLRPLSSPFWNDRSKADVSSIDDSTYFSPNVPLKDLSEADDSLTESSEVEEYSFFDEATIFVRAGSGGQGASTYQRVTGVGVGSKQQGRPDGGNGGRGGHVWLKVDASLNTLAGLTSVRVNAYGGSGAAVTTMARPKSFRAENGMDGARNGKSGRYGKDSIIRVPPGTLVEEEIEGKDGCINFVTLGSLADDESELMVAEGGQGGEGTGVQGHLSRGVRRPRQSAMGGERRKLKLTLKIVADVALVGVPNAGKSTFLASVTRAKPKIANYPFTTVIPNLGVWVPEADAENKGSGSDGLVLCDVPGLIAGASQGVGLGHAFLRHIERCHVILHLVDATSNDPIADYTMLNRELVNYGTGQLATMPQVVVVNKVDAWEEEKGENWEQGLKVKWSREELQSKLGEAMPHTRLMWMSAKEGEGVDELMGRLAAFVKKVKTAEGG